VGRAFMEVYEAIRTRRSIRKFKNDHIPEDTINKILEAANLAPTAGNRQPWEFIVIDRSTLDRLSGITDQSFKGRIEEVGRASYNERLKDLPIPMEDSVDKVEALNRFYRTLGGAPIAVVVHVERDIDPWAWKNNVSDASAAIENLILAAWNEGLGSCWMTGPLQKRAKEIQGFLHIPESREIVGIIPIGVPAHSPPTPPKMNLKSKLKWIKL